MCRKNTATIVFFGFGISLVPGALPAQEANEPVAALLRELIDTPSSAQPPETNLNQEQSEAGLQTMPEQYTPLPTLPRLFSLGVDDCISLLSVSGGKTTEIPEIPDLKVPSRVIEETFKAAVQFCTVQVRYESDEAKNICREVDNFVKRGVQLSADQQAIYLTCLDGPLGIVVLMEDTPRGLPGV